MPVSFPDWKTVLAAVAGDEAKKERVRQEVFGFLRFCKARRAGASVTVAKAFIAERERQAGNRDEVARRALRWFFKAAKAVAADRADGHGWENQEAERGAQESRKAGKVQGADMTTGGMPVPRPSRASIRASSSSLWVWLCETLAGVDDYFLGENLARGVEDAHRVAAIPEVQSNRDLIGGVHKAEFDVARSFARDTSTPSHSYWFGSFF